MNPYDRWIIDNIKREGAKLGSDGCGTIIQVGEKVDSSLIGTKVAFLRDGWGQYKVADPKDLMFLDDSVELEKAAFAANNPLSVCA